MTKRESDRQALSTDAALAGILALMVDAREREVRDDKAAIKTEVLLSNAGLTIDDIAAILGKKYDAVRVCLQRSRSK